MRVWSVRHRHAGPPLWLLIRRSLERVPEVKYYLSNAEPDTPLETMALVTGVRWRVEEFFEDGKGQLGMAQYEARSWTSWHHHMSLVALAHLYVTQTRRDLKRKVPELTLGHGLAIDPVGSAPPAVVGGGCRGPDRLLPGPQRSGHGIASQNLAGETPKRGSKKVML